MKLDNFTLEIYNENNKEHIETIDKIDKDKKSKDYLGNTFSLIKMINKRKDEDYLHNETYITYYNNRPVGYIALTHNNEDYELISGLIPSERNQHLGALLLQEFSEELFNKIKDIDKLTLKINDKNLGSIKCAKLVGYVQDTNEKYTLRR